MPSSYSQLSFFAIRLNQYKNKKLLGHGTGFLYKPQSHDRVYLITNYHVWTARNPINPDCFLPGYPDSPDEVNPVLLNKKEVDGRLYPDELSSGHSMTDAGCDWIEHPRRNEGVDIVAIPCEFPSDALTLRLDQIRFQDDEIDIYPGQIAFIVGFPFGEAINGFMPIWKRGSIASEPRIDIDNLPKLYVDSTSRPGMSGSPVFVMQRKQVVDVNKETASLFAGMENGEISPADFFSKVDANSLKNPVDRNYFRFVGIYSGRVIEQGSKDFSLGVVWKKEVIEELFVNPVFVKKPVAS